MKKLRVCKDFLQEITLLLRLILKPHSMLIFKERGNLHSYLINRQQQGETIGFVPTMGTLHAGHLSLLQAASAQCDLVVCSIFINPTQFNDKQDYEKYPVHTEEDIQKLLSAPTNVLFLPSADEIYPTGTGLLKAYDFGHLESVLEGAFRPGHFQGVGQVMEQLLKIVQPDSLFMGEKDYQQLLIINKLIDILTIRTKLIPCPVFREPDGLAMSSRNLRLSEDARKKAPFIRQTLLFVKENFPEIPFPELTERATHRLEKAGFKVDYISIADSSDLQILQNPISTSMICLAAAWLDSIRLIDNVFL